MSLPRSRGRGRIYTHLFLGSMLAHGWLELLTRITHSILANVHTYCLTVFTAQTETAGSTPATVTPAVTLRVFGNCNAIIGLGLGLKQPSPQWTTPMLQEVDPECGAVLSRRAWSVVHTGQMRAYLIRLLSLTLFCLCQREERRQQQAWLRSVERDRCRCR